MSLAFWFWVIYVVSLIFFGFRNRANVPVIVDSIVLWVLIAILGFGVFGGPIK